MSRKIIGNLTAAEMLAQIDAATKPTQRDGEWKTTEEWAVEWGVSAWTARQKLTKAAAAGLMEVEKDFRRCPTRTVRVPVYRWVGTTTKS